MSETKRARLVARCRNIFHGGLVELWDVGDGRGVLVDYFRSTSSTRESDTMAVPIDLTNRIAMEWDNIRH